MKKVLLTAMTLVGIASSTVFGMYGNDKSWIDFLVHGNQLRARMDQFGVTIGNGTIKGTVGFKANNVLGNILKAATGKQNADDNFTSLNSTISAGIGYTSPAFGIGVGYNYTYVSDYLGVHTPVLMVNAMNDNLRVVVPVQIAASDKIGKGNLVPEKYFGLSMDPEIRYYTGIDAVSHIRLTVRYGMNSFKENNVDQSASSFGFEFRVNFLKTTVGNVILDPFFRVKYNTALEGDSASVTSASINGVPKNSGGHKPYNATFDIPLGLSASSDTVSLYLEPSLGYQLASEVDEITGKANGLTHSLFWGAYAELYVTPVKDLEWYFEMNLNNSVDKINKAPNTDLSPVYFETSTGITWYLPSFNNAQ